MASITFDIFAKDHASAVFGKVAKSSDGLKGKLGGLGKVASAVGGAALAGGLAGFAKGAIDAAAESQKVAAQTDAVLKSTGAAAGVNADHIGKLAHSLQGLSGVQDEAIQTGQNMLLTFTNVQNGVGKGNDIFDQASKVMLDMSVATGTDAKSAALQLGKALNDPIKGVSKLSKVGVTFTDQQKDQIKMMVAAGDTAGAQKVILGELNKEFGGSAKAAGDAQTPMQKLALAFGDLQETIGTKLLPVISALAGFLAKHKALILPVAAVVGGVLVAAFVAWAAAAVTAAAATVAGMASAAAGAVATGAAFVLAFAPFFLLGAAIAALVVVVIKNWDTIKAVFKVAVDFIAGLISGVIDFIKNHWQLILGILTGPIGLAVLYITTHFDQIVSFVTGLPARIAKAASGMWDGIKDAFRSAVNWIIRAWNKLEFKIPGFDPPGPGPKFGGITLGMPNIKELARGGIVTAPTLALIGEAGPEAVVPLGKGLGGGVKLTMNVDARGTVEDAAALGDYTSRLLAWRLGLEGGA